VDWQRWVLEADESVLIQALAAAETVEATARVDGVVDRVTNRQEVRQLALERRGFHAAVCQVDSAESFRARARRSAARRC
jgi:hypothetical protein